MLDTVTTFTADSDIPAHLTHLMLHDTEDGTAVQHPDDIYKNPESGAWSFTENNPSAFLSQQGIIRRGIAVVPGHEPAVTTVDSVVAYNGIVTVTKGDGDGFGDPGTVLKVAGEWESEATSKVTLTKSEVAELIAVLSKAMTR